MTETVNRLVGALAAADPAALHDVLHENVTLQALLPTRYLEVAGSAAVAGTMLGWVSDVPALDAGETRVEPVGDTWHAGYVFRNAGVVMQQHAFCTVRDDRITRIRLVCSGTRPDGAQVLDALGDGCATLTPKIAAELKTVEPGGVLGVLTDDPGAADGIAAWSRLTGHGVVAVASETTGKRYYVRRRAS
jgi:TusA-related sulfurtransferase